MAAGNFALALALVLESEGGYVDDPRDPGGATNLGITRATLARWRGRVVSKADVRQLGRAEAAAIYRALFWDKIRGDDLLGVDSVLCGQLGVGRRSSSYRSNSVCRRMT